MALDKRWLRSEPTKKAKWTPPRSLPQRTTFVPWTPPPPFSRQVAPPNPHQAPPQPQVGKGQIAPEKKKYGYVGFPLSPEHAAFVKRLAARIDPQDLAGDGVEQNPHVTALYGLHDGVTGQHVQQALQGEQPPKIKLGPVSTFPPSSSSEGTEVLKVDVHSPDLHRLHQKLRSLPHTLTHPDYKPHITVAYVKPGTAQKYIGPHAHQGTVLPLGDAEHSTADKAKTQVRMGVGTGQGESEYGPFDPPGYPPPPDNSTFGPFDPPGYGAPDQSILDQDAQAKLQAQAPSDQQYQPPPQPQQEDRGWPGQVSDWASGASQGLAQALPGADFSNEVQRRIQNPQAAGQEFIEQTPGWKTYELERQIQQAEGSGDQATADQLRQQQNEELSNMAIGATMGPAEEHAGMPHPMDRPTQQQQVPGLLHTEGDNLAYQIGSLDAAGKDPNDAAYRVGTSQTTRTNEPPPGKTWRDVAVEASGRQPFTPEEVAQAQQVFSAPSAEAQGPVLPTEPPTGPPAPPAQPPDLPPVTGGQPPSGEFPSSGGMGETQGMRSPQEAQSLVNTLADAKENVFGVQEWDQQRSGALALGLDEGQTKQILGERAGDAGVQFAEQEPQKIRLLKNVMAAAHEETADLRLQVQAQQQRVSQGVGMGVRPASVVDDLNNVRSLYELAKARLQVSMEAFGASRTAAGRTLNALQDRVNGAMGQMILGAHDFVQRAAGQGADLMRDVTRQGGISDRELNGLRRVGDAIEQHADVVDTNSAEEAAQQVQRGRRPRQQGTSGQPPAGGQGTVPPSNLPEEPSFAERYGQLEREEFLAHARPEGQPMSPEEQTKLQDIQARKSALLDEIQADAEQRALAMEPRKPGDPKTIEEIRRLVDIKLGAQTVATTRQAALEAAGIKRPVEIVDAIVKGLRTGERQVVQDDAQVARYWADNAVKFPDEPGYRQAFQDAIDRLKLHGSPTDTARADKLVADFSDRLRKQEANLIRQSVQRNTKQVTGDMAASERNMETLQAREVVAHLRQFETLARDNPRDPMLAQYAEQIREQLMLLGQKSQEKAAAMRRQMIQNNVRGWVGSGSRDADTLRAAVDAMLAVDSRTPESFAQGVGEITRLFADPVSKSEWFTLLRRNSLTSGLGTVGRVAFHSGVNLLLKTGIDTAATAGKVLTRQQSLGQGARELNMQAAGGWYGMTLGSQTFWDLTSSRGLLGMLSQDGVKALPTIANEWWKAAGLRMSGAATPSMIEQGVLPRSTASRILTGTEPGASRFQQGLGTVQRGIAHGLEYPSRLHGMMSDMAKMGGQYAQQGRLAAQQAMKEGLTGDAAANRIQYLMQYPTEEIVKASSQVGKRMAQQRDYGYAGHAMEAFTKKAPLLSDVIEPFRRISYSTDASMVEKSPVGLAGTLLDVARGVYDPKTGSSMWDPGRYARSFSRENLSGELGDPRSGVTPLGERLAMNAIGTAGFIWALNAAFGGEPGHEMISGDGPDDPEMRKQLTAQFGWQPHSINVGGNYTSYLGWGGLAFMLAAAASFPDQVRYNKQSPGPVTAGIIAAGKTGKFLMDDSVLRGISAVIQAVQDPQRYGTGYLDNFMSSLMPEGAIVGQATSAIVGGPLRRAQPLSEVGLPEHVRQALALRGVPLTGGPGSVPLAQNKLGQPADNPRAGFAAFSPFTSSRMKEDPLVQAYTNLGIVLTKPPDTIPLSSGSSATVKLTTEQRMVYQQAFGKVLSAMWEKTPPSLQQDKNTLEKIQNDAQAQASGAVLAAMNPGDLRKALSLTQGGGPADQASQGRAMDLAVEAQDTQTHPKYAVDLGKPLPQAVWSGLDKTLSAPAEPGPKSPALKAAEAVKGIADAQSLIVLHSDPRYDDWNRWFGTFKNMSAAQYDHATEKGHPRYLVPGWGEPQYKMADYVLQLYRDLPAGLPPTTQAGLLRAQLAPAAATLRRYAVPSWRLQLNLDGADFADLATQQVQNPNDILTGLPAGVR